jgi:hypothetical protein
MAIHKRKRQQGRREQQPGLDLDQRLMLRGREGAAMCGGQPKFVL